MNICTNYSPSISKKDNIPICLYRVTHYQVKFSYWSSRKYEIPNSWYIQSIWNELFMLKMLAAETSAEFLKKPINSHLQLYIISTRCSKCNFAKICRMKQFEIWGKSTNLWLLWYFRPIKCTFWIKLNIQYTSRYLPSTMVINESWLDCCATCCEVNAYIPLIERRDLKKKYHF